ncbi:hypothetical protein PHISP_02580 [Aspergillus sp. HF37]|nr:hypothetical protein PHISP_02580 [Aspergillus sp. HF37]
MAEDTRDRTSDSNNNNKPPRKQDSSSAEKEKQDNASLASRVQDSASGLARNAFFTPGPPQDISRSLPGGSKAAPSSLSSASSLQPVADQYRHPAASSSAREHAGALPPETFRSSSSQQDHFGHPSFTEDEFQHTYDAGVYDNAEVGKGKGKGKATDTGLDPSTASPSAFDTAWQKSSLEAQQPQPPPDGAVVASLLSERTFDPEFPPSANESFEPVDTELSPMTLTPEEVRTIELFRRHMPAPEPTAPSSKINHASLVPDIGSFLDSVPTGPGTDAAALRDDVLTSLPGAEDWLAVEERYHDEVWGYLRPTLEAAAKEMEESKDSRGTEDGPAVRRLKMVLKHMQG